MFYTNVVRHKNKIFHIGYDEDGKFVREEKYSPYVALSGEGEYRTIHGEKAIKKYFDSIWDRNNYIKQYKDVFDIYDDIGVEYQFLNEKYPQEMEFDIKKLTILVYDIEAFKINGEDEIYSSPDEADAPITAITIKDINKKNIFVLSTAKFYEEQMDITVKGKIYYRHCLTEESLLNKFVALIEKLSPDILCGFFSDNFDDPYIINRIKKVLGEDIARKLSPVNLLPETSFKLVDNRKEFRNKIHGISLIDFLAMFKKYYVPTHGEQENYKLGHVASVILGDDKVGYQEYDNLYDLYINNPQKFVEYSIYDVELLDLLNEKLRYIELQAFLAYKAKCLFEDVFSPVKTWDCFIYSFLNNQNIVIPPRPDASFGDYTGAYVKQPVPGIYKWVVSVDATSLYPSMIRMFNISSDTIVDDSIEVDQRGIDDRFLHKTIDLSQEKYIVAGSGNKFRKDKRGMFPILMENVFNDRVVAKNKMLELKKKYEKNKDDALTNDIAKYSTIEQALKVFLNSAYGAMAENSFRYYDLRLASSITLSGQLAVKWISEKIDKHFKQLGIENSVIYGDTDSVYFTVNDLIKGTDIEQSVNFINNYVETELQPYFDDCCNELKEYMNCNENHLYFKRENICEVAAWQGKKRYVMLIWDSEGVRYKEPKMKVKGIEIVRSSTPKIVKEFLKETIRLMLTSPEMVSSHMSEVKKKFMLLSPEDVAFPRSANNLRKWSDDIKMYKKGCPIAVRASLVFNAAKEHYDDLKDFSRIMEGEKIKFIYLRTPNKFFNENVVAFIRRFPGKRSDVDYSLQFEKTYTSVINNFANKIGITIENNKETDLMELFS
jgi:DNA polymerase elongation subunit (family B)